MTLTPATFDQWMKALGSYRKNLGRLRDGKRFCCLGVLADIEGAGWSSDGATLVDEDGDEAPTASFWRGASSEPLHDFLDSTVYEDGYHQVAAVLAGVNDESDTFEPVKEKARELWAQYQASQR